MILITEVKDLYNGNKLMKNVRETSKWKHPFSLIGRINVVKMFILHKTSIGAMQSFQNYSNIFEKFQRH